MVPPDIYLNKGVEVTFSVDISHGHHLITLDGTFLYIDASFTVHYWYKFLCSVRPFENLVYEDYNDDYYDEYDSEDSNQENYFKNDYPDTEEEDDMTVENMRQAMEDADLGIINHSFVKFAALSQLFICKLHR